MTHCSHNGIDVKSDQLPHRAPGSAARGEENQAGVIPSTALKRSKYRRDSGLSAAEVAGMSQD